MDAFYAAIEQRDNPGLRGRPVIVGADPRGGRGRGVVSTASYEARPFGVGSAMPISQAYRLCPQAVYLPVNMEKYVSVSRQVMEILLRASDLVEPLSIDEAFVDVTGSRRVLGDGETIARRIQQEVRAELGLTASVGLATCKLVAKIASDMRKPDGLVIVPPGGEAEFLAPLPVRRLWGVGPTLEAQLAKLGVHTIGALAALPQERLERRLGSHGHDLRALARGVDDRPVIAAGEAARSIGHEHTYERDTADLAVLRRTLLDLADAVARRLRSHGLRARTLTLKYRDETFRTLTRAATLASPVDSGNELFGCAWSLFQGVHGRLKVRLLGLSASHFGEARGQFALFPEPTPAADRLRDALAERFGDGVVTRASLLGSSAGAARRPPRAGRRD